MRGRKRQPLRSYAAEDKRAQKAERPNNKLQSDSRIEEAKKNRQQTAFVTVYGRWDEVKAKTAGTLRSAEDAEQRREEVTG